jgi:hypothetical protein
MAAPVYNPENRQMFVGTAATQPTAMASEAPETSRSMRQRFGAVSDEGYQQWADEVLALPVRKRKNWKGCTMDTHGCLISVRYAPQDVGLGVQTLFESRPTAQVAGILNVPVGSWLPLESLSIIAEKAARRQARNEVHVLRDPVTHQPVGPLDEQAFDTMARAMAAESHTGNHRPRTHPVHIPTAAGQPVRG